LDLKTKILVHVEIIQSVLLPGLQHSVLMTATTEPKENKYNFSRSQIPSLILPVHSYFMIFEAFSFLNKYLFLLCFLKSFRCSCWTKLQSFLLTLSPVIDIVLYSARLGLHFLIKLMFWEQLRGLCGFKCFTLQRDSGAPK
jgi:hypothetical protein